MTTFCSRPITDRQLERVCSAPLGDFIQGKKCTGYLEQSSWWMRLLHLSLRGGNGNGDSDDDGARPAWRREMVWMMREYGPESFALEYLLDDLEVQMARGETATYAQEDMFQNRLFLILCRIIDRRKFDPSGPNEKKLSDFAADSPQWDFFTEKIRESQERLLAAELAVPATSLTTKDKAAHLQEAKRLGKAAFLRKRAREQATSKRQ